MTDKRVEASDTSTAIGGDNSGNVFNARTLNVQLQQRTQRELPMLLGEVLVFFSQQKLSNYGKGSRRRLLPEVDGKLEYNWLDSEDQLCRRYVSYVRMLDDAYQGAEQYNSDTRHLVRMKAGTVYAKVVNEGCVGPGLRSAQRLSYVRTNASGILQEVVGRMLAEYRSSSELAVASEIAEFAVQLIVFDAVVECEVLERPPDVVAA